MSKFRFTIITAFYNTGDYLKKSIESVINQDIGFEDNVQLILVDDGSTDDSRNLALFYQASYPQNILVLSKENGGPGSARNLGLQHVEGDIVNFLDSDDLLTLNTLSEVDNFILNNDVEIVTIPVVYFGKKEGDHHLNYKYGDDGIIDLTEKFNYPQASISSAFIKFHLLKDKRFNTDLINGEDLLLLNKLLIDVKRYAVINSAQYMYRKRFSSSSIMDTARYNKKFFMEKMELCFKELIDYSLAKEGYVPKFIQYLILLDLTGIIASPVFEDIDFNQSELDEFWSLLTDVLNYIDEDIIKDHGYLPPTIKLFCIFLKNKDFNVEINSENRQVFLKSNDYILNRLHNHKIYLDILELKKDVLFIEGSFTSNCKDSSLNFEALAKSNGQKQKIKCNPVQYPNSQRETKKFLGISWKYIYNFEVEIPITNDDYEIKLNLLFEENNQSVVLNPEFVFKYFCNLTDTSNYYVKDSRIVFYRNNAIYVAKKSSMLKLELELKSIYKILNSPHRYKLYSIYIRFIMAFAYILLRNKKIWLLMDRPTVADDNARFLFEYSVKQDDDIEKYYIVDRNTDYYNQMLKIDKNIVPWGSLKHKILYLYAEKLISSHSDNIWLNPFYKLNPRLYSGLATYKKCFLQHGVTKDDISSWLTRFNHNFYLFLTSSDYERDAIINGNFNFASEIVQTLGFPRFDMLENADSLKQILFIPTWRNYLKDEESFRFSEYYEVINNFFNNEKILNLVNDEGYKIVFKPHFNIIPYLELFNIPSDIRISLEDSYHDLINNSSLLITDYSSVSFDFAYLKKPVIYYRGDDEYHFKEGYFDFETMGFGEIIDSEELLLDKIKEYFENNFEMEDEYKERVDKFFKFKDKNNSKRVYEWLKTHEE